MQASQEISKDIAIDRLMAEIRAGHDSVRTEEDWVSEEEMLARLGIVNLTA